MESILQQVCDFYLSSREFNGLPAWKIAGDKKEIQSTIRALVEQGSLVINFGDRHPNPHILAFDPEDTSVELAKFDSLNWQNACLYPSRGQLSKIVGDDELRDQPYNRLLRLGEPQLAPRFFDLTILEFYRNDPRYYYDVGDIQGKISVKSKFYDGKEMRQEDKTFLQTFGFGYSQDLNVRVVAAFNWYLSRLTAEHQQIWRAKELSGDYFAHPDYIRTTSGHFPERVSILVALLEEIRQINELCQKIGRPQFFRNDFCDDSRPRGFAFLLRPTLKEYRDFVHLLDKMLSENISRDFFLNEVPFQREIEEKDGRFRREDLGSLTILENWLTKYFRPKDPEPMRELISTFRRVRKERQPSAHRVEENQFDMTVLARQRELIQDVYGALRTLRLVLMNYPGASEYSPPEWLQRSKFWLY